MVGATGYVGSHLTRAFSERGHRVTLLSRSDSEPRAEVPHLRIVSGDPFDRDALARVFDGADTAVFLIGILRERPNEGITFERLQYDAAVATIEAARAAGVRRLLLMSANGVRAGGTPYQDTKYRAEQAALASGLEVAVFRPSVIFGDAGGCMEIATQLLNDMVKPPLPAVDFFSAFGPERGRVRMSPVHVRDVTEAYLAALEGENTPDKPVALGGPEILTWAEMVRRVAAAVGRSKWFVPMPVEAMRAAATLFDRFEAFPVTRDQLTMLAEGNIADSAPLEALTGRPARRFDSDELSYLQDA